jgi:hypothetical protein
MSQRVTLPKRGCGDCRVCCIVPEIKEPELVKASGVRCAHLCKSGCSIHEAKPSACREFNCAWRVMPEIDDSWRPDRVGLLGIVGRTERGAAVQFIPFRSTKVLALPDVARELRRLVSMIEVWVGLSSGHKLHLNQLPNRRAWRKLATFNMRTI